MTWYLNLASVAKPVPDGRGQVTAVRPGEKVEVFRDTPEVRFLVKRRVLRLTGGPPTVVDDIVEEKVEIAKVVKTSFSLSVAEKGVTSSRAIPPRKEIGDQEMTDGELVSVKDTGKVLDAVGEEGESDQVVVKRRRRGRKRKTDSQ